MIKFKHFNKEGIKKAGSIALVTTILTTGICTFSGCGKQDKNNNASETTITNLNEDKKNYGVVIENDIAVIYEGIVFDADFGSVRGYIRIAKYKNLGLPLGETHLFENHTLEEVEEYARMFLTENGKIEYYNVEGKGKTLTRTKDNS